MPMLAANPSPLGTLSNFDTGDGPRTDRTIYLPMDTCPGTYQSASWVMVTERLILGSDVYSGGRESRDTMRRSSQIDDWTAKSRTRCRNAAVFHKY